MQFNGELSLFEESKLRKRAEFLLKSDSMHPKHLHNETFALGRITVKLSLLIKEIRLFGPDPILAFWGNTPISLQFFISGKVLASSGRQAKLHAISSDNFRKVQSLGYHENFLACSKTQSIRRLHFSLPT